MNGQISDLNVCYMRTAGVLEKERKLVSFTEYRGSQGCHIDILVLYFFHFILFIFYIIGSCLAHPFLPGQCILIETDVQNFNPRRSLL